MELPCLAVRMAKGRFFCRASSHVEMMRTSNVDPKCACLSLSANDELSSTIAYLRNKVLSPLIFLILLNAIVLGYKEVSADDIQTRLKTLAELRYTTSDYQRWVSDGQLATLYARLKEQRQWSGMLKTYVSDKQLPKAASRNLQRLLFDIQVFYTRYIQQAYYLGAPSAYHNPDMIVILGANRRVLEQRLAFALPLVRKFSTVPVVLSGGGRTVELEARVMYDFLIQHGVAPSRLILETDSLDTVGNAIFTYFALARHSVSGNKILLITSNFHAPRALFLFQQIGDPGFELAVGLAPYEGKNLAHLIDSELQQEATSIANLLHWGRLSGQTNAPDLLATGTCSIFFQTLLHHSLYPSRWDLARRYADICDLSFK
jgi:hypothetical protein